MLTFLATIRGTDGLGERFEAFQADDIDHAVEQAIDSVSETPEEFVVAVRQADPGVDPEATITVTAGDVLTIGSGKRPGSRLLDQLDRASAQIAFLRLGPRQRGEVTS